MRNESGKMRHAVGIGYRVLAAVIALAATALAWAASVFLGMLLLPTALFALSSAAEAVLLRDKSYFSAAMPVGTVILLVLPFRPSLMTVLLMAASMLAAVCLSVGIRKTENAAVLVLCGGAAYLAAYLVWFFLLLTEQGGISAATVERLFADAKEALTPIISEQAEAYAALYAENNMELPAVFGEEALLEATDTYLRLFRLVLPGVAVTAANIVGFLSEKFFFALLHAGGRRLLPHGFQTREGRRVRLSLPGALIYLVSLLLLPLFVLFGASEAARAVLLNLTVIYLPAAFLGGMWDIFHPLEFPKELMEAAPNGARLAPPPKRGRTVRIVGSIVLLVLMPPLFPFILSLFGTVRAITDAATDAALRRLHKE